MRTHADAVRAASEAMASYDDQARQLRRELDETHQAKEEVQRELEATLINIRDAVVTTIDPVTVSQLADMLGAPQLNSFLAERMADKDRRRARVQALESEQLYARVPELDVLRLKMADTSEAKSVLKQKLARYEFPEFEHFQNKPECPTKRNWFVQLLRVIFFIDFFARREETRCFNKVVEVLKCEPGRALREYSRNSEAFKTLSETLREQNSLISSLETLVREREKLLREIENFDPNTRVLLLQQVLIHLHSVPYETMRSSVPDGLKILFTKCFMLSKKIEYLTNLEAYLKREIVDREGRISKLSGVRRKWSRSPGKSLRKDMTTWLVDGPAAKAKSTSKQLRFCGGMRTGIYGYNNYTMFDAYMDAYTDYLVYDYLFFHSGCPMAPDAFACQVIPDVQDFRVENNQERPDYTDMKAFDKGYDGAVDPSATGEAAEALAMNEADGGAAIDDDNVEASGSDADMADKS